MKINTNTKTFLLILFAFIAVALTSCVTSEEAAKNKIAKLVKKFPSIAQTDSILRPVSVPLQGASIDTSKNLNKDIKPGLDSIFKKITLMQGTIDSLQLESIKQEINNYVINKNVLNDTLTVLDTITGTTVKVWEEKGKLRLTFIRPDKDLEAKVWVPETKVVVEEHINWFQRNKTYLWVLAAVSLLALFIIKKFF